jgi:hypothetical protein
MSLRRRLFRLWMVLTCTYVFVFVGLSYSSLRESWREVQFWDRLVAVELAENRASSELAETRHYGDEERRNFWLAIVPHEGVLTIGPPLLTLALGWGVLWAVAPKPHKAKAESKANGALR